jgi:hypothetical protein
MRRQTGLLRNESECCNGRYQSLMAQNMMLLTFLMLQAKVLLDLLYDFKPQGYVGN